LHDSPRKEGRVLYCIHACSGGWKFGQSGLWGALIKDEAEHTGPSKYPPSPKPSLYVSASFFFSNFKVVEQHHRRIMVSGSGGSTVVSVLIGREESVRFLLGSATNCWSVGRVGTPPTGELQNAASVFMTAPITSTRAETNTISRPNPPPTATPGDRNL